MKAVDELLAKERAKACEEGARQGALAFRARCRNIYRSAAAEGRFVQATVLALETELTAEVAIKVLAAAPLDREAERAPGMVLSTGSGAEAWAKALARPH